MPRLVTFALAALLATSALAQTPQFSDPANLGGERVSPRTGRELPIDSETLGLEQLLRKLNTRASILNIVAHPDDEDGGMLTLYARGMGARVADLSLTRGEGGQNAMTGDFEDALGLLRTQELLANDRYTGVTQMFGTEVDFGFSKTKSEAFSKWTHERVLYDAVRAIRTYRPLVITATFIGNPTDGHGQHQVSGEIAQEAFIAAGDPNVFPELTKEGILPWKPLKMYARVPRGAISGKGLFDYATNQNVPAEFTNYITHVTTTTPPSTDIVVHEGTRDPLLTVAAANRADLPPSLAAESSSTSLSYVQFARIGLGLQKSQIGPGARTASSGSFDVDYHLYSSRLSNLTPSSRSESNEVEKPTGSPLAADPSFFDGIDTSLEGIVPSSSPLLPQLKKLATLIQHATSQFDPAHPQGIVTILAEALQADNQLLLIAQKSNTNRIEKADTLHELRIKRVQLNDALALALRITFYARIETSSQTKANILESTPEPEPTPAVPYISPDSTVHLFSFLDSKTELIGAITFRSASLTVLKANGHDNDFPGEDHEILTEYADAALAPSAAITRPYFMRSSIEQPTYTLIDPALRNAPLAPPPIVAVANLNYHGVSFELSTAVEGLEADANNTLLQPVSIVPPVSVALSVHAQVLPSSEQAFTVYMSRKPAYAPIASESIEAPSLKARPLPQSASSSGYSSWQVEVPSHLLAPVVLQGSLRPKSGESFTEGFRPIGYGDLPRTNYFTPATDRIVPVDLKLPTHRRIAYLPGTGDAAPEAFASIGLPVTQLTVADLTPSKLAAYDTVILGVRTYSAHPDLHGAPTQALLDFARNGGNVVVQYQTGEFTAADAPYPLDLGSDEKVVDETAPVALLKTQDSLLTTPNNITPADFNNWIEERGHGFMSTWDEHYTALTETHDPGSPSEHVAPQLPQRGGLLTVQLGKGRWTYVAFALYRQLPEAVPGAYRLFLNLLDNPR
jgi:LmbE family N-acetylglucosaminyl deacetylase